MVVANMAPGKVAGIGLDLVRVDRIQRVFDRFGDKFVHRILGPAEIVIFQRRYRRDP